MRRRHFQLHRLLISNLDRSSLATMWTVDYCDGHNKGVGDFVSDTECSMFKNEFQ